MSGLQEKVILVTGGGRGLGEAICRDLALAGATMVIADLQADLAHGLAAHLRDQGARALGLELDVADEGAAQEAFRAIMREFGGLDGLINNAAIDLTVSLSDLSVKDWNRILATNLTGPFIMSKLALSVMKEKGAGHIVNICSTASKRAWANASAYHASKWGLLGFSHALHVEGRQNGIKVTALLSGGMRTPFLLDRFPGIDVNSLQDPANIASVVRFVLTQPRDCVIPEVMAIPMRESSWP